MAAMLLGAISQLLKPKHVVQEDSKDKTDSNNNSIKGDKSVRTHSDSNNHNTGMKFPSSDEVFGATKNMDIDSLFPELDLKSNKSLSELSFLRDADDGIHQSTQAEGEDEVSSIVNSGVAEFHDNFMTRIGAAFQLQVENITDIFSQSLQQVYNTIEEALMLEMLSLESQYRDHVIEIEDRMFYYVEESERITKETYKRRAMINSYIGALQHHIEETDDLINTVFQKTIIETNTKIQEIKTRLQIGQNKEIQQAAEVAVGRFELLEDKYKKELEMFGMLLEKIQEENKSIEVAENERKYLDMKERLVFTNKIKHLKLILNQLETEKNKEINDQQSKVRKIKENNYNAKGEYYESELEYYKKALEEEKTILKNDLEHWENNRKIQEALHKTALNELKLAYRDKVTFLVESIHELNIHTEEICGQANNRTKEKGTDAMDNEEEEDDDEISTLMEPRPNFPKQQNSTQILE